MVGDLDRNLPLIIQRISTLNWSFRRDTTPECNVLVSSLDSDLQET